MARRVAAWLFVTGMVCACGNEDDRPPLYTPEPKENLWSCRQIAAAAPEFQDGTLVLDGSAAECAVTGLICPLDAAFFAQSGCTAAQTAVLRCVREQWQLGCETTGASGAGPGGQGGAGPVERAGSAAVSGAAGRQP